MGMAMDAEVGVAMDAEVGGAMDYVCVFLCQEFGGDIDKEMAKFEQLLASCGLLETPFDQSQFESDVSAMKDKMKQCEKVRFMSAPPVTVPLALTSRLYSDL